MEQYIKLVNKIKKRDTLLTEAQYNLGKNVENYQKCMKKVKNKLFQIANEMTNQEVTYMHRVGNITPIYEELSALY